MIQIDEKLVEKLVPIRGNSFRVSTCNNVETNDLQRLFRILKIIYERWKAALEISRSPNAQLYIGHSERTWSLSEMTKTATSSATR